MFEENATGAGQDGDLFFEKDFTSLQNGRIGPKKVPQSAPECPFECGGWVQLLFGQLLFAQKNVFSVTRRSKSDVGQ